MELGAMRKARKIRPSVDGLEPKTLLSAGVAGPQGVISIDGHPSNRHHPGLSGQISGTYQSTISNPDVGQGQTLSGTGQVTSLGHVSATATLHQTGFIRTGEASGTLTLQGAHGSATLNLVGPQQSGFSQLPATFQFTVASSAGTLQSLATRGTITLHETAGSTTGEGTFTLTIRPHR
jgi:hypothetical protein